MQREKVQIQDWDFGRMFVCKTKLVHKHALEASILVNLDFVNAIRKDY